MKTMKFKEIRSMPSTSLRSLCIKNHWYTCGNNEEYSRLFDRLTDCCGYPENLTTEKLTEIAVDIWEHSEITGYTIETVLFELARNCFYHFTLDE